MVASRRFLVQVGCFLAFSAAALFAMAAQYHAHKAPHNGVVAEADGTHFELVVEKNGQANVYVYDKSMKPTSLPEEARINMKAHDGTSHSQDLRATKDAQGASVLKGDAVRNFKDWDTAVLTVKSKDRPIVVRFSHHHSGKKEQGH